MSEEKFEVEIKVKGIPDNIFDETMDKIELEINRIGYEIIIGVATQQED